MSHRCGHRRGRSRSIVRSLMCGLRYRAGFFMAVGHRRLLRAFSRGGANAGSKARCARESVYGMRFSRNHRNAAAIVAELAQDRRCVQAERLRPPHGRRLRVSAMRRRALRRGLAAAPAAIRPRQCASAASVDIALFVVPRVTDPEAFRQPGIGPAYDARDVYCRLATRTMRSTSRAARLPRFVASSQSRAHPRSRNG